VNRWPAERFAELADLLAEGTGKAIIIGGPDDVPIAEEIISRSRSKPLSVAGKTTLLQLGAVLEKCSAAVSGDTGPLHMATAVGTRAVALFGAADPSRTGPVGHVHRVIQATGISCIPCRSRLCANPDPLLCMRSITAQTVADVVAEVLRTTPSPGGV
jgi:ADP-heptose:LPS heptosyltransferase